MELNVAGPQQLGQDDRYSTVGGTASSCMASDPSGIGLPSFTGFPGSVDITVARQPGQYLLCLALQGRNAVPVFSNKFKIGDFQFLTFPTNILSETIWGCFFDF